MTTTTAQRTEIIGGVDTHQDLHTTAIINVDGAVQGTAPFATTRVGYRAMLRWFRSHGELLRVGVEVNGSYGAGIARHLALAGVQVFEVTGPDPAKRRSQGKDDALDGITETIIELYKTGVICGRGPWRHLETVELATLEWVEWFNHRQLFGPICDLTPVEKEEIYYQNQEWAKVA